MKYIVVRERKFEYFESSVRIVLSTNNRDAAVLRMQSERLNNCDESVEFNIYVKED